MPGATVLAVLKGPRVGAGSVLVGQGNERVWVSGVGAEELVITPGWHLENAKMFHYPWLVNSVIPG